MNNRMLPLSATGTRMKVAVRGRWNDQFTNSQDTKFLRSWLVYDSGLEDEEPGHMHWNTLLGLALVISVSASFWAGIGLIVAHVWK